jgi:CRISPR-associated protein Cas5 subtype I-B
MSSYKAVILTMKSDFAHWRNPFSLSVLETFLMPQKTTILGIFGAICGVEENELEELQENLKVGVKLEKLSGIVLDTTMLINLKEKGLKTPTSRQLLFKPFYTYVIVGYSDQVDNLISKAKKNIKGFPTYAGTSDMLAETEIKNEIENVRIERGKGEFFNVSIPYFSQSYEWKIKSFNEFIVPPRVMKKTLSFKNNRREREFIDILEGYNVQIKPSWDVEYIVYKGEVFPIF